MKILGHYLDMRTGKELPIVRAYAGDNEVRLWDNGLQNHPIIEVTIPGNALVQPGEYCRVALEFVNDFLAGPDEPLVQPMVVAVGQDQETGLIRV